MRAEHYPTLAANLRWFRLQRGWNRTIVAERSGRTAMAVCKWENGGAIRPDSLHALSIALAVTPDLLTGPAHEPTGQQCMGSGSIVRSLRYNEERNRYEGSCSCCGLIGRAIRGRSAPHQRHTRKRKPRLFGQVDIKHAGGYIPPVSK